MNEQIFRNLSASMQTTISLMIDALSEIKKTKSQTVITNTITIGTLSIPIDQVDNFLNELTTSVNLLGMIGGLLSNLSNLSNLSSEYKEFIKIVQERAKKIMEEPENKIVAVHSIQEKGGKIIGIT